VHVRRPDAKQDERLDFALVACERKQKVAVILVEAYADFLRISPAAG